MSKKAKTGIIRKGAVVPFIIISTLVVIFNIFFLDGLIENSIEYLGGKVNGAQVDVSSVKTSFSQLSVEVNGIAFTNAENPTHNLFAIGQLRFGLLWDALLRAKFVVEEVKVADITVAGKRKSKGEVYPIEPVDPQEASVASETLENAQKEFDGNVFGDIAGILGGTNSKDILKNIQGSLASEKKIDELEIEIKNREEKLKSIQSNLPESSEISQFDDRFKAIDWNGLKDLKKAPKVLKEANNLKKDVENAYKSYDHAVSEVKSNIDYVKNEVKGIESLIKKDIQNLSSRVSIPGLDPTTISKVLFGADFIQGLKKYEKYFAMAKQYMPPKKSKEEKEQLRPAKAMRAAGENFQYPKQKAYPLFWIKKVAINSKNDQGNVYGTIEDISSNQGQINRPTVAKVVADFPPQKIRGIKVSGIFDHRKGVRDKINANIKEFPVARKKISDSNTATLILSSAVGSSEIVASLIDEKISLSAVNQFSSARYEIDASEETMKTFLNGVANDAKKFSVKASASGQSKDLSISVNSDLGSIIANSVKRQLSEALEQAKAQLKSQITGRLDTKKANLKSKLNGMEDKYLGQIKDQQAKLKGIEQKITKNESTKTQVKEKGKELLDKLKKKFKF